jgi:hypothetical protein
MVLLATGGAPAAMAVAEGGDVAPFQTYYGTAASASSYGGYGGNANKKDSAEYIFDVPQVRELFSFSKRNHTLHQKAQTHPAKSLVQGRGNEQLHALGMRMQPI